MIVRINQFDAPPGEGESGWAGAGVLGPVAAPWPAGARAFEVLILDHDEQRRPLPESFRRQQLRQLIPQAVEALREPGEAVAVRLDGPLADRELLPALRHLTDAAGRGRYSVSAAQKLEHGPQDVLSSVRLAPTPPALAALCADAAVGLERSVRLRLFTVPERLLNPLLDIALTDDERWGEVLEAAGFMLTTVHGLRSLHVVTRRIDATTLKARLMQRLVAAAATAGAAGARSAS